MAKKKPAAIAATTKKPATKAATSKKPAAKAVAKKSSAPQTLEDIHGKRTGRKSQRMNDHVIHHYDTYADGITLLELEFKELNQE